MYQDIWEYVKTCESCQKHEAWRSCEPLHLKLVKAPFHMIRIDIDGPLPVTSRTNWYIVVATDYITKWPEACAIPKDDAKETNGLVEQFNKTLCSSLARLMENVRDWDLLITLILFAYWTAKQASICETPFYLVYRRKAKLPLHPSNSSDLLHETIIQRIYEVEHDLQWAQEEALRQIRAAQNKQKAQYDQQIIAIPCCAIGDKVIKALSRKKNIKVISIRSPPTVPFRPSKLNRSQYYQPLSGRYPNLSLFPRHSLVQKATLAYERIVDTQEGKNHIE
ncbi:5513_t:CDS:2, partial [Gigaspora rosea]